MAGCASSDYGDDKDRVVIRSDGSPPTSPATLPTLQDKRAARVRPVHLSCSVPTITATSAGSWQLQRRSATIRTHVEMLIGQLVNLVKDGRPVRMGKRAGNVVTLEDLVEAVGVDAARYAL